MQSELVYQQIDLFIMYEKVEGKADVNKDFMDADSIDNIFSVPENIVSMLTDTACMIYSLLGDLCMTA